MELTGKSIVITGAASGIGRAMAQRFAAEQPARLVLVDINEAALAEVAEALGAEHRCCDLSDETSVTDTFSEIDRSGQGIDLYCGNAGVLFFGGLETPSDAFGKVLDINVMAHVYAMRALLPGMLERGGGYALITASAAGLLTQLGSLSYSVSKHAALSVAEWLAVTYADRGLKVSALCPQAVETAMTAGTEGGSVAGIDGMLKADAVAEVVLQGLRDESFLILPHPEVKKYFCNKANDYDRWVGGMASLQRRFAELEPKFP